jgi:putative transposase
MARPLRIEFPGAHYHVMNRGNARNDIFLIDGDYEIFLVVLEESAKLFGVEILSFCLMTNHYHLLIHTPKGNLSRFMRHLGGVYTQRFNKIHKKDGHLFRGRFKAILVQEDGYLTHLIRYIHLNPVQANVVQDPKQYPWSSHRDYLKAKDRPWLKITQTLRYFSSDPKDAKKHYLEFMNGGLDLKTKLFFQMKNKNPIFGDVDFIDRIKETYLSKGSKNSKEIPGRIIAEGQSMLKRIKKKVSRYFGIKESGLYFSRRGEYNKPRAIALSLSRDLSGLKLEAIAKSFQIRSYKTVSSNCQRLKACMAYDRVTWKEYGALKGSCIQGET